MDENQKTNYEKVETFLTDIFCGEDTNSDIITAFHTNLRKEYLGESK